MDIGVDVGTTVTKAVAFDEDGRQLAEASRPTRLVRPGPGRFEHDTDEIVASVNEVVGELAAAVGNQPGVLAITAQGDGLWLVDVSGYPVRPAISWLDARSSSILERWTTEGVGDLATGCFPGHPARCWPQYWLRSRRLRPARTPRRTARTS
jgi:xylulokinase/erythritol kinase